MPRPMGVIHFSSMQSTPYISPYIAAMVPAVQSVSSPKYTAVQMDWSKSPAHASMAYTVMNMLLGTSQPILPSL